MFHDEIKNPRACAEALEKFSNQIQEISRYAPEYQFTSLVAQEHFGQALTFLAMAKHSMALCALHEAREVGNKRLGR